MAYSVQIRNIEKLDSVSVSADSETSRFSRGCAHLYAKNFKYVLAGIFPDVIIVTWEIVTAVVSFLIFQRISSIHANFLDFVCDAKYLSDRVDRCHYT